MACEEEEEKVYKFTIIFVTIKSKIKIKNKLKRNDAEMMINKNRGCAFQCWSIQNKMLWFCLMDRIVL